MAIHQTKQQSDLEKRLKILHQQLYGKGQESETPVKNNLNVLERRVGKSEIQTLSDTPSNPKLLRTDSTYLYQDLLKISLLTSVALGSQIILFILMKNQILNFKLF